MSVMPSHARTQLGVLTGGWRGLQVVDDGTGAVGVAGLGGLQLQAPAGLGLPVQGQAALLLGGKAQWGGKAYVGRAQTGAAVAALLVAGFEHPFRCKLPLRQHTQAAGAVEIGFAVLHQIALPALLCPVHIGDDLQWCADQGGPQRHHIYRPAEAQATLLYGVAAARCVGGELATTLQVALIIGLPGAEAGLHLQPQRHRANMTLPAGLQAGALQVAPLGVEGAVCGLACIVDFAVILLRQQSVNGQTAVVCVPKLHLLAMRDVGHTQANAHPALLGQPAPFRFARAIANSDHSIATVAWHAQWLWRRWGGAQAQRIRQISQGHAFIGRPQVRRLTSADLP